MPISLVESRLRSSIRLEAGATRPREEPLPTQAYRTVIHFQLHPGDPLDAPSASSTRPARPAAPPSKPSRIEY